MISQLGGFQPRDGDIAGVLGVCALFVYIIVVFMIWFRQIDQKKLQRREAMKMQQGFEVVEKTIAEK